MKYDQLSGISGNTIREFIQYKRMLGYKYDNSIVYQLLKINQYINSYLKNNLCTEMFLSRECVNDIIRKVDGTQKYSYASLLRQLGLYLFKIGKPSYILPDKMIPKISKVFNPYIFDYEEVYAVIYTVDSYCDSPHLKNISIHNCMPCIIRLIYSCGLRISEVLNIKIDDIDFNKGCIYIRNSKKNRSRYVPMCESMSSFLDDYIEKNIIFNADIWGKLTREVVYYHYKQIISLMPQYISINKKINLHTLRHTAAVHMLAKMAKNNFDINHSIYLLSVMLGHKTIRETEIYLHLPYYEFNNFSCNEKLNSIFPEVEDDEE